MHNVVAAGMLLRGLNGADATDVVTGSDGANVADLHRDHTMSTQPEFLCIAIGGRHLDLG